MLDHISASQMSMFARCQAAWMFRYQWDLVIQPKGVMTRGSCIHRGIAHNYFQKIESREDLPVDDVLDHYSTNFDEEAHVTAWKADEDKGKVKDDGVRTLKHYQEVMALKTQPVDVERRFSMGLSWEQDGQPKHVEFQGILDLATEEGALVDHKSTGLTPREPRSADQSQLVGYWLGKEAMDKAKPSIARLDYLVTLKTPKIVSFEIAVTDDQKKFLLSQIPKLVMQMEGGNYFANRSNMYCSATGCGYWEICHKEFGG